jgi:hypothetical protein
MQKKEKTLCACCGASMEIHKQRLTKGLIVSLLKFRNAVFETNCNEIHVQKALKFTNNEYCNFQKMRYHGLIAKVKESKGKRKNGYWLLTRRGGQFCKGEIKIPFIVYTFRNKINSKSEKIVGIQDILKSDTNYWDKIEDFKFSLPDIEDFS